MSSKSSMANAAFQHTTPTSAFEDVSHNLSDLSIQDAKEILSLSPIPRSSDQYLCSSPPDVKRLHHDEANKMLSLELCSAPKSLYIQDAFRHSYSSGPSFALLPRKSTCPK